MTLEQSALTGSVPESETKPICSECPNETRSRRAKTCSLPCWELRTRRLQLERMKAVREEELQARPQRKCLICLTMFTAKGVRLTCSKKCRNRRAHLLHQGRVKAGLVVSRTSNPTPQPLPAAPVVQQPAPRRSTTYYQQRLQSNPF